MVFLSCHNEAVVNTFHTKTDLLRAITLTPDNSYMSSGEVERYSNHSAGFSASSVVLSTLSCSSMIDSDESCCGLL